MLDLLEHEIRNMETISMHCPPADTSRHDELCRKLWEDYGIVAIHFQDKRETQRLRGVLARLGNRKYGKRAL